MNKKVKNKVYCIKDYFNLDNDRYYYKYKSYYITVVDTPFLFVSGASRNFDEFVFENDGDFGMWFSKNEIDIYFTDDISFMRELKLERICNDGSIL